MIKFYGMENLNCPGFSIGNWLYVDFFNSWGSRGMFIRIGQRRYWIYLSGHIRREPRNNRRMLDVNPAAAWTNRLN